ncbi:MAG TPA: glycosyl hydrolase [Terriglobales bacterium]
MKWIQLLAMASLLFRVAAQTAMASGLQAPPIQIDGPVIPVPQSYFGMHIHRPLTTTPWPDLPFKTWRLWDTGTTWADLEPRKGEWHFDTLDGMVKLAAAHQVEVLLTFGRTPGWASSDPQASFGKVERAAPRAMEDWRDFVRAVATRYKGRIRAYEVWNEPNLKEFYSGDVPTLVEMTREAADIVHSVDPSALVTSPSPTTINGVPWLEAFLQAGGARYVDVIAYHLYVTPDKPEQIVPLARAIKAAMAKYNAKLPLWNTEIGWSKPKIFADDYEASAYVARSLLLAWASGVERFYWYAWDNTNWVTLKVSTPNDFRANTNALAYKTMENWITGKRVKNCSQSPDGTWVCRLMDSAGDSYIFWNPDRTAPFQLPIGLLGKGSWFITDLDGRSSKISDGSVPANLQPRLISPHQR